jgi:hypothetical protein
MLLHLLSQHSEWRVKGGGQGSTVDPVIGELFGCAPNPRHGGAHHQAQAIDARRTPPTLNFVIMLPGQALGPCWKHD